MSRVFEDDLNEVDEMGDAPADAVNREPLANYSRNSSTNEPGVIVGIERAPAGTTNSYIRDGFIYYVPESVKEEEDGEDESVPIRLANYNNPEKADNEGIVAGIVYVSTIDAPRIVDGIQQLPIQASPEPIEYNFDPEWFTVSETGGVSINGAALDDVIAEAVGEIGVTVTSEGVLTNTEFGQLNYQTTTTSAPLASLALDTSVSY